MNPRNRVLLLSSIMVALTLIVESVAVGMLYKTAINETRARLQETAKSQARLIEAIARFVQNNISSNPVDPLQETLSQIIDAHNNYQGFGKTGEFTLSKREGDQIIFLLNHRHYDHQNPQPVAFNSKLAQPMQLALSGKSGTIVGFDYRGEVVLAAYEPVRELNLGIVAKIDLAEVRAPFIRGGTIAGIVGIIAIVIGVTMFIKVTNPLVNELNKTIAELQNTLSKVKTLSGLLPICASCKKIRDDKGYWNQIESYLTQHTDADFSHSL